MRLMVRPLILVIVPVLLLSARADQNKDRYEKAVEAVNAGDAITARNLFCSLPQNYRDTAQQCHTYREVAEKTLFRYKMNYADGMAAMQKGDFVEAEAKFRNVKGGDYAELAKEKLVTITKWTATNPGVRPRNVWSAPSIYFGEADLSLGMTQDQIERRLTRAGRHLAMAADQKSATVVPERDPSTEGQIKFDSSKDAIYIVRTITTKTSGDLTHQIIQAIAATNEIGCELQTKSGPQSSSGSPMLLMFCGPYVVRATPVNDPQGSTELNIQLGSSDPTEVRVATVLGNVIDEKGAPMPGVVVLLENKDTGFLKQSVTAADGSFTISRVPAGAGYMVTASTKDGDQIGAPRTGIDISPSDEREVLPPLRKPAPVAVRIQK